jgi:DNA-binding NarL/FixJ family response regulator
VKGSHGALPQASQTRVLIADPRPIAACGLAAAFADGVDLVVRAVRHEAQELRSLLGADRGIDAVVVDVEMFDGNALASVQAVRWLPNDAAVLLLTTRVDARLLEAIAFDYVSCVSAYSDGQAIVAALRALVGGHTHLPQEVQRALTDTLRRPTPAPPPHLTSREEQVLELAATGLTVFQIATRLHISHSTAKTHLLRVYEKLEAPNRSAAVATALARGILQLSPTAA